MFFRSNTKTVEELAEKLGVEPANITSMVESGLVTLNNGECDAITWVQFLVMRDLICLNADMDTLKHVAEVIESRSFEDHDIGAIPFTIAYEHTNNYIRITIRSSGDMVVEVGTPQKRSYTSLQHGTEEIPYIANAPEWASPEACMISIQLDWYLDMIKPFLEIQKTTQGIAVRLK